MNLVGAAVLGVAGLALLALTIRRPVLGCVAVVFLAPLTAGLVRGAVVPGLKPSESSPAANLSTRVFSSA